MRRLRLAVPVIALFLALLPAAPVAADEDVPPHRQFDFWVGTWDVFTPDGKKAGENTIEIQLDGKLLAESWKGSGGSAGRSINYWDPAKEAWVQVWVDKSGGIIATEGRLEGGAMRLVGTHVLPGGKVRPFRMTFTPQPDGKVRPFIEESQDGGETWATWFDGMYVRRGE